MEERDFSIAFDFIAGHLPMPDPGMIGKAIAIYLGLAYPGGTPDRIAALVSSLGAASPHVLGNPAFALEIADDCRKYRLRLGCAHYPHMKFVVTNWPEGCFFQVDAHDKHILVPPNHAEYAAIEELRRRNLVLIESIENAWKDAKIPTFDICLNNEIGKLMNHDGRL